MNYSQRELDNLRFRTNGADMSRFDVGIKAYRTKSYMVPLLIASGALALAVVIWLAL